MLKKKMYILLIVSRICGMDDICTVKNLLIAASGIGGFGFVAKHFITIYKEKKTFGEFYKYKGKIKELIEESQEQEFKKKYSKYNITDIKQSIAYETTSYYDWSNNHCGDTFLEKFIDTVYKPKEKEIKKYKKFFLENSDSFNTYIDKKMGYYDSQKRHIWFQKNFPGGKLVAINNNGKEESITLPAGKISKYKEVLDSLPGKIISDNKNDIIQRIQKNFCLIKKIMLEKNYSAKLSFPMYILHGEPGTGKTIRIKEIFLKLCEGIKDREKEKCLYITLKSSDIVDKYVGESEKKINAFFDSIIKMGKIIEDNGFILVHIDEIESLAGSRDNADQKEWTKNIVNLILTGVDDLRSKGVPVLILGSTNHENQIDDAIKRAGRLKLLEIEKPTEKEKKDIIDYYEKYFNNEVFNITLTEDEKSIILKTSKTGADIRTAVEQNFLEKLEKDYESNKKNK